MTYLSFSFEDFTVCEIWQLSRTVTAGLTLGSVPDSIMLPLGRVVKERFLTDIPVEFICACVYRRFCIKNTKNSALTDSFQTNFGSSSRTVRQTEPFFFRFNSLARNETLSTPRVRVPNSFSVQPFVQSHTISNVNWSLMTNNEFDLQ